MTGPPHLGRPGGGLELLRLRRRHERRGSRPHGRQDRRRPRPFGRGARSPHSIDLAAAISPPSCLRSGTRSIPTTGPLDAEKYGSRRGARRPRPRGGRSPRRPSRTQKAPAPTVEEHAREKYTNISALLSGPSDAIPTLGDYDAIKAEEQELARYLEQYDKADAAEPDPAPTEEDEEIGSFRLGKCKYCGREWGRNPRGRP